MDKPTAELIKKNSGILRQFTSLNNEIKELKGRVKELEEKEDYSYKVGGTDPD